MSTIRAAAIANLAGTGPISLTGQTAAKAWMNLNGTGTVAIRASANTSSVTDLATGCFSQNFTAAMTDADYAGVATVRRNNTNDAAVSAVGVRSGVAPTVNAFTIQVQDAVGSTASPADPDYANVVIVR